MTTKNLFAIFFLFFILSTTFAQSESSLCQYFELSPPGKVDAQSVIVIEMENGETLYELNADKIIPPASLTKIMTMMITLEAAKNKEISLSDNFEIVKEDTILPYRSSLMYLKEGYKVTINDLLMGMAVVSGNDAALTLAKHLYGSIDAFAAKMNSKAMELGLNNTYFVEPSGLSELNTTTARDMSRLARFYITEFPFALQNYHSKLSMEFPKEENLPENMTMPNPKVFLRNRNDFLFRFKGADGLKTGYIDESGYNLIATAKLGNTRIISVTLGGQYGTAARTAAATKLLNWAFDSWQTVFPPIPEIPELRVWGSANKKIAIIPETKTSFTMPKSLLNGLRVKYETEKIVKAPVQKGDKLGQLTYVSNDKIIRTVNLVAEKDAPLGNIFIRIWDSIVLFFNSIFHNSK